jgi:mono/diheme cytochrome c family protein
MTAVLPPSFFHSLRFMTPRFLLILAALASQLFAQDGQQLFTLNCSICHGADGKGGVGANYPPLAESPWLMGDADRAIKIVLKGLGGPVEVMGRAYNLQMPAQGAVLQDDKIAAILTYARSAWGNNASAVTPDYVKKVRDSVSNHPDSWTGEEILKLHPLPIQKTALSGLKSQVYKGPWKNLPDFKTLKAENIEEEHDGIISLKDSTLSEDFGMVWEGKLTIPAAGEYLFYLDTDDAGKITLDHEVILEVLGNGPMDGSRCQKSVNTLTQGPHDLRVEYLQNGGNKGITVGWRAKSAETWNWLTDESPKKDKIRESLMIQPTNGRPVIYRNFIEGTTSRAIGIGFPGGLNLAYSADILAPAMIWTGNFIDGSHKWLERGTENSPPAGTDIVTLNKTRTLPKEARFKGYKLDAAGNPTFAVQLGEQFLRDSWQVKSGSMIRKLSLSGQASPLVLVVSDQDIIEQMTLKSEGGELQTSEGKTTLTLTPGKPVTLTYHW